MNNRDLLYREGLYAAFEKVAFNPVGAAKSGPGFVGRNLGRLGSAIGEVGSYAKKKVNRLMEVRRFNSEMNRDTARHAADYKARKMQELRDQGGDAADLVRRSEKLKGLKTFAGGAVVAGGLGLGYKHLSGTDEAGWNRAVY
jgi:hypothetical protein